MQLANSTVTSNTSETTDGGGAEVGQSGFLESIDTDWGQQWDLHSTPYDILTSTSGNPYDVREGDDWFACDESACSL